MIILGKVTVTGGTRVSAEAPSMTSRKKESSFYKKIIVPIDFSQTSKVALRAAADQAAHSKATLLVLHVLPVLIGGRFLPNTSLRKTAQHDLQVLCQKYARHVQHKFFIDEGSAFQVICKTAESERADVIMMSTHGYTGYKHTLLGSTTERVIRYAPCPTFVIGAHIRSPRATFKNILVPVDFSRSTKPLIKFTQKFAKAYNARISLLHVVELPLYPPQEGPSMDSLKKEMQIQARRKIKTLAKSIPAKMLGSVNIRVGDAFDEIAAEGRSKKSDLILISTHGYTGIQHMLLGSTTEKVLRSSPCPVLVKKMNL
jgi:nucleotide-binding universal stress UspA family protein